MDNINTLLETSLDTDAVLDIVYKNTKNKQYILIHYLNKISFIDINTRDTITKYFTNTLWQTTNNNIVSSYCFQMPPKIKNDDCFEKFFNPNGVYIAYNKATMIVSRYELIFNS